MKINFSYFVAHRYFFSKKKRNFINILSFIAMIGVAIGTMALVIAPAIINGLEENIKSLYDVFDPDLKVKKIKGKHFSLSTDQIEEINSIAGIQAWSPILEDNALLKYQDGQIPVKIKGVEDRYLKVNNMRDFMVEGDYSFSKNSSPMAIISKSIQMRFGISLTDPAGSLKLYYPKEVKAGTVDISKLYNQRNIYAGAVFSLEHSYSENIIFLPLSFARDLFDNKSDVTGIEINIDKSQSSEQEVINKLSQILGDGFDIQNSEEQHAGLIRAIQVEKLFLFLVFSFILFIASFNLLFSLTMLVIEKKDDIKTLYALGASKQLLAKLFFTEGLLISFIGAFTGFGLGLLIVLLQDSFGFIGMGVNSSMMQAYPVKLEWQDLTFTILAVLFITTIASIRPAYMAMKLRS